MGVGKYRPCLFRCHQPESAIGLLFRDHPEEHDLERGPCGWSARSPLSTHQGTKSMYRTDLQLLLDAVDGGPSGHRLNPSRLVNPGVVHAPCKGDEYLTLPRGQLRLEARHSTSTLGRGVRAEEAFIFHSVGQMTILWEGTCPPWVGPFGTCLGQEHFGNIRVIQDEGRSTGKTP